MGRASSRERLWVEGCQDRPDHRRNRLLPAAWWKPWARGLLAGSGVPLRRSEVEPVPRDWARLACLQARLGRQAPRGALGLIRERFTSSDEASCNPRQRVSAPIARARISAAATRRPGLCPGFSGARQETRRRLHPRMTVGLRHRAYTTNRPARTGSCRGCGLPG